MMLMETSTLTAFVCQYHSLTEKGRNCAMHAMQKDWLTQYMSQNKMMTLTEKGAMFEKNLHEQTDSKCCWAKSH